MPPSVSMEALVGAWDLVGYHVKTPDGVSTSLWDGIRGRLIYTLDGYVSVVIVRQADSVGIGDVICYSGSFVVEGDQVKHSIHVSTIKRYQDALEIRRIELKDGILILNLENHPSGKVHTVQWTKI